MYCLAELEAIFETVAPGRILYPLKSLCLFKFLVAPRILTYGSITQNET